MFWRTFRREITTLNLFGYDILRLWTLKPYKLWAIWSWKAKSRSQNVSKQKSLDAKMSRSKKSLEAKIVYEPKSLKSRGLEVKRSRSRKKLCLRAIGLVQTGGQSTMNRIIVVKISTLYFACQQHSYGPVNFSQSSHGQLIVFCNCSFQQFPFVVFLENWNSKLKPFY